VPRLHNSYTQLLSCANSKWIRFNLFLIHSAM
jgi:hypothetical protein